MIAMTQMENIVMLWTGCTRSIANTVVNDILEIDCKTNEEQTINNKKKEDLEDKQK